jgi:hypothetical protein
MMTVAPQDLLWLSGYRAGSLDIFASVVSSGPVIGERRIRHSIRRLERCLTADPFSDGWHAAQLDALGM